MDRALHRRARGGPPTATPHGSPLPRPSRLAPASGSRHLTPCMPSPLHRQMGHHEAVSPPPPRQLRAGAIPLLVVSHEVLRGGVADTVLTGPDPRSGSLCLLPQRLLLRFE